MVRTASFCIVLLATTASANDLVTEAAPAMPRPDTAPVVVPLVAAVAEIEAPDADTLPAWLQARIAAATAGRNKDPDGLW